jgi:tRNA/rRNA methyltransferase
MARAGAALGGRVDFVLVRPARAPNVAAACRAMKNMGLRRLRLVDPPTELAEPEARALAYRAWDVLDGASVHASVAEAVAGASFVVATSSRAGALAWTPRELADRAAARCGSGGLAVVFGPEAAGLTLAERELCHEVVTIPADPEQPSLNLAQAVLLVAYELFVSGASEPASLGSAESATAGSVERALDALRAALLGIGYLNPANPHAILAELRRLLARAGPTPREVSLLEGMARQIGWAASEIARLRASTEGRR